MRFYNLKVHNDFDSRQLKSKLKSSWVYSFNPHLQYFNIEELLSSPTPLNAIELIEKRNFQRMRKIKQIDTKSLLKLSIISYY